MRTPENIIRTQRVDRSVSIALLSETSFCSSGWTVRRILHTEFKLNPYKIIIGQEFIQQNGGRRRDCCNAILAAMPSNGIVWNSDEAHFHLCSAVKEYWKTSRNDRICPSSMKVIIRTILYLKKNLPKKNFIYVLS